MRRYISEKVVAIRSTTVRQVSVSCLILMAGCAEQSIPAIEAQFISVNKLAVKQYAGSENSLQHQGIIQKRNEKLCKMIPGGAVEGWVGVVQRVGVNVLDNQESASIDIRISETKSFLLFKTSAVNLKTLSGTLSDSAAAVAIGTNPKTAILKNTKLYEQLMNIKKGDTVTFDGVLLKDPKGCFYELSLSTNGKIRWPEYAVRLTSVVKLD